MDVSWIPGSADALVLALAALAALGGTGAALLARRRSRSDRSASQPGASPWSSASPATTAPSAQSTAPDAIAAPDGRMARLSTRLGGGFGSRLRALVAGQGTTDWDAIEEVLLAADVGAGASEDIVASLKSRLRKEPDADVDVVLRDTLMGLLALPHAPLDLGDVGDGDAAPVVVVGVNGVGKTTTIGKIARLLTSEGYSVTLGAADTFRAAAADQLTTWGSRIGVETVRSDRDGADPASVAFQTMARGVEAGSDVVIIDTAGRLQNKSSLMDELGKMVRVIGKTRPVREVLLVLDATTGQNGLNQARVFAEVAAVTGIVLTKMDGTAKGGIALAVQRELGVPIRFIGLGEGEDDLAEFDPAQFVAGLLG